MLNDKGEEVGIIYCYYCIPTDKYYVGQTVNPEKRFKRHINDTINKKDNSKFHRAIRKYGLENFIYCVLEDNVLRDNLNMREIDWIEYYDSFYSGYNLTLGADGAKGVIMTKEVRKRISESRKGKHLLEETKRKLSESGKGRPGYWTGKTRPEETRKKLSESHKGKPTWNKGLRYTFSKEEKDRMYKSRKKKVNKYDLYGNYIQTYNSVAEAMEQNPKCVGIYGVCSGRSKQSGGFIWKFAS